MAVTTKKTFNAVGSGGQSATVFTPVGIELNNQDDLDVYVTLSGGTRVLNYRQSTGSTTDSNHPQVNDTTGLYFPAQNAGVTLQNYQLSADNNTITFNSALPSGAVVSIERRTRDSSSDYTSFASGSTIRHTDLNRAFDESNFTAQEGRNKAFDLERIIDPTGIEGKVVTSGALASSATQIPTSSAVSTFVLDHLDAIGGFIAIPNEVSFPNDHPDVKDDAGTVVAISDAGGISVDSNGTSTTGRTLGGATVTITDFPAVMRGVSGGANKLLPAGMGLLVKTTGTLNTYNYHKGIATNSDIITISDTVNSFNQRYRFGPNDPTSDNDDGDLFYNTTSKSFKVFDASGSGQWILTVPTDAQLNQIAIVSAELGWSDDLGFITEALVTASGGDINTVADNITSVNRYADEYKIASSAPGSPSAGDLWYDTGNNVIKYYTGSAWLQAFTPNDILDEDNMSSNSATKVPTQQSVKAYVDVQTDENFTTADHAKLDGIEASATADQTAAEIRTLVEAASDSNVFTDADHSKLNAIEASATADQTAAEIRTLVDSATDSNVFTDNDHSKLDGIEASATADQTDAEIRTAVGSASDSNIFTDALKSKLDGIEASATADQTAEEIEDIVGAMVSSNTETGITVTYQDADGTIDFVVASQTDENFTTADHAKLDGIEASATADQTAAEIRALVESASDSNVFTDDDHSKLNGIEASATADQSNAEIRAAVEAASDSNVFTDADHTKLNGIAASANNYAISSDLLDEDNMSSNSATKVPSQQSVKAYVDTEVAGVVDSAPGALNTLNELAAALGDDANFSTTVTNSIATKLPLGGGTMTGNIVMSGSETVDGRDLSVDGAKLDGIEASATADQTNAEIRAAVEAASDSNVFTDADHTKLNGIAANANNYSHPTSAGNVHIPSGGSSGQFLKYDSSGTAVWAADNNTTYSVGDGGLTQNNFTNTLKTKLDGIEASATADQSNAEIRAAVEAASDSNVFTDDDHSKLNGIAASANNYTHPNHSGEVTSSADGATVIADNVVDEANLKVSNSPTNGYVLTARSGNTGGLTWEETAAGSDTTYTHTWVDSSSDAILRLTAGGSGSGNDDLTIVAGSNVTLTPSGDNLTIASTNTTYSVGDGGLTQNNFTNTLKSKLDGIEASATADQSAAEIVALIAGQTIAPNVITTTNLTLDFGSIA